MSDKRWELHEMDCRLAMSMLMDENSVDSIVCDPPYGLSKQPDMAEVLRHWLNGDDYTASGGGFMGKTWDSFVPGPSVWREAYRVLKPGGHLLAFFGTRTYDLGCTAIRLAGFEVRDMTAWLYGSGFPKSHNLSGEWNGWGTALKPALEPIVLARKPLIGTVAQNVRAYRTGGLNIDGCRVGRADDDISGWSQSGSRASENRAMSGANYDREAKPDNSGGRWPANVIHDGSDEVLAAFPSAPGQLATASTSETPRNGQNTYGAMRQGSGGASPRVDTGSAARFYYCAKASKRDRDEGCVRIEPKNNMRVEHSRATEQDKLATRRANHHPTVKPTDLMRYLCRLVTPPGGLVFDPFTGSGSTGKAAMLEGFRFLGCEMDPEYAKIARARISHACSIPANASSA